MKKILLFIVCLIISTNVYASEKQMVTLEKCVDGDTAWFNLNNEKIKARFLGIDTPESTNKIEKYGVAASEYTCSKLKNASSIEIEYDDNSDKLDKYDRHLVWVFVDNKLLQEEILKEGLAEVKYIYGDYKYLNDINKAQDEAKINKLNIWSNYNLNENIIYTIVVITALIIIVVIFKPKKSTIKKLIKKYLK